MRRVFEILRRWLGLPEPRSIRRERWIMLLTPGLRKASQGRITKEEIYGLVNSYLDLLEQDEGFLMLFLHARSIGASREGVRERTELLRTRTNE